MTTDSFMAYRRALRDTTPAAARDTVQLPPQRLGQRVAVDSVPLPYREFVVVPPAPLPPETSFLLRIDGLTNISGVTGGGGEVEFTTARRPAVRPDTGATAVIRSRDPLRR